MKKEQKFIISKKTIEECIDIAGKKPPKFKDVVSMDHTTYLKAIESKDALLICSSLQTPDFSDNIQGECDECKKNIYYRLYNQNATKKVCEECGMKIIERERNKIELSPLSEDVDHFCCVCGTTFKAPDGLCICPECEGEL